MRFHVAMNYLSVVEIGKAFLVRPFLHLHREILALKELEREHTANISHNALASEKHLTNYFMSFCGEGEA